MADKEGLVARNSDLLKVGKDRINSSSGGEAENALPPRAKRMNRTQH
jgi:hypothetical protein